MAKIIQRQFHFAFVLLLAACGGSGGGGSDSAVNSDTGNNYALVYQSFGNLYDQKNKPLTEYSSVSIREYALTQDGRHLVYIADPNVRGVFELFWIDLNDSNVAAERISRGGITNTDLGIKGFELLSDSSGVVYWGDPVIDTAENIYHVDFGNLAVRNKISQNSAGDRIYSLSVSPNDDWVAFTTDSDVDNLPEAYVATIEGQSRHKINGFVGSPASVTIPVVSWSQNGDFIVQEIRWYDSLLGWGNDTQKINIHEFDPDDPAYIGNNSTQITNDLKTSNDSRAYTELPVGQDATLFKYTPNYRTTDYALYHVKLDNSRAITELGGSSAVGANISEYSYSPDKQSVFFRSDKDTKGVAELYVTDLSSPSVRTKLNPDLLADRNVLAYEVSPDGEKIVYRADQNLDEAYELYLVERSSAGVSVRLNPPLRASLDIAQDFQITPDSRAVLFRADIEDSGEDSLYVVYFDNPGVASRISVDGTDVLSFRLP